MVLVPLVLIQRAFPVIDTSSGILRGAQQCGHVSTVSKFWKRGRVLRHVEIDVDFCNKHRNVWMKKRKDRRREEVFIPEHYALPISNIIQSFEN